MSDLRNQDSRFSSSEEKEYRVSRSRDGQHDDSDYPKEVDSKSASRRGSKSFFKKKVCKFCVQRLTVDYKDLDTIRRFITERGKILSPRITGTCARHQRPLANAIKRARALAMLPFVSK